MDLKSEELRILLVAHAGKLANGMATSTITKKTEILDTIVRMHKIAALLPEDPVEPVRETEIDDDETAERERKKGMN
jgi:hypothetical protein